MNIRGDFILLLNCIANLPIACCKMPFYGTYALTLHDPKPQLNSEWTTRLFCRIVVENFSQVHGAHVEIQSRNSCTSICKIWCRKINPAHNIMSMPSGLGSINTEHQCWHWRWCSHWYLEGIPWFQLQHSHQVSASASTLVSEIK